MVAAQQTTAAIGRSAMNKALLSAALLLVLRRQLHGRAIRAVPAAI